ncbi:alcohol dehydrogenase catalytic domain-containing protein [Streptomyces sp. NPDC096323]|uniref:zinc-dependent alcohol dehydrogenase n=1 Tax=Streptomyces sp. NPDC096323 TaxID=3155822 RepID=UPI00332FF2D3
MSTAVLVTRPGVHELVTLRPVGPGPDEALVRVHSNGLCGSDADVLSGARPDGYVRYPLTPGHEWSGVVERVGAGVSGGLVGRKVVGEGVRGCEVCERCRTGENTLCLSGYEETGFTRPGGMAQNLVVPARSLYVLPDEADLAAAALLEPAACAMAAVLAARARPDESVAVLGDGVPGLLVAQLLAASGARGVTVAGSGGGGREELALAQGAAGYVAPGEALPSRCDVVIHTAGAPRTAARPAGLLGSGGRLVCTNPALDPLDPREIVKRQLTVHSVSGAPSRAWALAVGAFVSGRITPGRLITHTFTLEAYGRAVELLKADDPAVGKVLLRPTGA